MNSGDRRTKDHNKYMLDTNVFNHVLDGLIPLENFKGRELYATHVQHDELSRTPSSKRQAELLSIFKLLSPNILPTDTAIWDDSRWDQANWSSEDDCYKILLNRIKELDNKAGKNNKEELNQSRDALIAETAIKAKCILITNDSSLTDAARENGCVVIGNFD